MHHDQIFGCVLIAGKPNWPWSLLLSPHITSRRCAPQTAGLYLNRTWRTRPHQVPMSMLDKLWQMTWPMCFNVSPQTIIKLKLFKDDVVAMRMRATNPKVYLLPNRMFVASGFSCEKMLNCNFWMRRWYRLRLIICPRSAQTYSYREKGRKTSPFHLHPGVAIVTTSKGST